MIQNAHAFAWECDRRLRPVGIAESNPAAQQSFSLISRLSSLQLLSMQN